MRSTWDCHHTCFVTLAIVIVTVMLLLLIWLLTVFIGNLITVVLQACLLGSGPNWLHTVASSGLWAYLEQAYTTLIVNCKSRHVFVQSWLPNAPRHLDLGSAHQWSHTSRLHYSELRTVTHQVSCQRLAFCSAMQMPHQSSSLMGPL